MVNDDGLHDNCKWDSLILLSTYIATAISEIDVYSPVVTFPLPSLLTPLVVSWFHQCQKQIEMDPSVS